MKSSYVVVVLASIVVLAGCGHRHRAHIVLQEAAVSVWDDKVTVGTQMELQNIGSGTAHDVRVTRVKVKGGTYKGPGALPTTVGELPAGKDAVLDAVLKLAAADGSPRTLIVEGRFREGGDQHRFRAEQIISPNAAPTGPIASVPGQTTKQNPGTATYPPPPPPAPFGPNSETPIFVPIGPPRQLFPPTPTGTSLGTGAGGASVTIPRNTSMRTAGVPPDPNSAAVSSSGVVLATYNTGISFSKDGGQTFTDIATLSPQPGNPSRTTFFPQSVGGLCCDQVVVYLANQNLFVWLMQYNPVTACATNCPPAPSPATPATFKITQAPLLRIAWATPAAIVSDFWNAWTYADLTATAVPGSTGLGTLNTEWLDYPDLAWSNTFLYVAIDHGNTTPGKVFTGRRIVARLSLADIANTAATTLHYDFAELTGSNGLNKCHFVQGAPGQMVLGSLDNSSTLHVFTWPDSSGSISPATVGVSQIQQGSSYTSTAPDGIDWLASSFPGNITGAAYRSVIPGLGQPSRDEYLFAFDAGVNAGGGRPQSYLRLETLTPSGGGYSAFAEYDVWNPSYAFAMGALGSDGNLIGITLAVGGGTVGYAQESVGYKDDFVVFQVTNSNASQVFCTANCPPQPPGSPAATFGTRFGDYFPNRLVPGSEGYFAAEAYDVVLNPLPAGVTSGTCATVGCTANMRFVEYGRPPVAPPK